ncbi:hypothetical protein ACIHFE_15650 [Streptomyces sp. NPDC052396]|uniref:hypothetical protein n=1 Tax=Streptomyces sp. NPDC052396 TaxID=3365689 RepID=UPI0037D3844E
MTEQQQGAQRPVKMTMRVSRDTGRTWGPTVQVPATKEATGERASGAFPPCGCPRCAPAEGDRCAECARIKAERAAAFEQGDASRVSDCIVLMGRHLREAHA